MRSSSLNSPCVLGGSVSSCCLRALGGKPGIFGHGGAFRMAEDGPDGPLSDVNVMQRTFFVHARVRGVRVLQDFVAEENFFFRSG